MTHNQPRGTEARPRKNQTPLSSEAALHPGHVAARPSRTREAAVVRETRYNTGGWEIISRFICDVCTVGFFTPVYSPVAHGPLFLTGSDTVPQASHTRRGCKLM